MSVTACAAEDRTPQELQSVVLSLAGDKTSAGNHHGHSMLTPRQARQSRRQCASVQWPSTTAVAAIFCVLGLLVAANTWDRAYLIVWMKWLQQHEEEGRVVFVLGYAACLLLLLPASVLAVLAGVCFGLYWGIILVYVANVFGQTLAFLLARSLLHRPLRTLITSRWPQFPAVDAAVRREGWRLVFVLRLSPCIPFAVLNYALGLTGISLLEYSAASAVAIIPFVVIAVYLGLASGSALQMLQAHAWSPAAGKRVAEGGELFRVGNAAAGNAAAGNATLAAADIVATAVDGGGAHSMAVTVMACVLAVATGVYSIWFVRRVTSEALADVLEAEEGTGGDGGGAGGGSKDADEVAEVTTPPADVAQHSMKRSARHGDPWGPAEQPAR